MPYGDVTLGADHRWSFNNVLTDSIGSSTITNIGGAFVTTPITRDATHSYRTNNTEHRAEAPTDTLSGNSGFSRYAFQGWFMVSQIQGPPTMIYKQGGNTSGFAIFLWAGNNVMLQVRDINGNNNIQIFSDIALTNNRPYHFFVKYSGSGFDNEIEFYIDGVKQLSNRNGVTPGTTSMTSHTAPHTWGENGDGSTDVPVGSQSVTIKAPVDGFWSEWWTWIDADADITPTEINDDLFGAGAIPELTITSGTQTAMQSQIDTIANTVRGDVPLCILIQSVTGDGNLSLSADNITFNPRASIHIRYEGTGTLNWTNTNGSNAVRTSGNVNILNPSQLTLTGLQNSTEVRVYEAGTQTEVAGEESVTNGTFSQTVSVSLVDIVIMSLSYQYIKIENIDTSIDTTIVVQQFFDRQYNNPV